MLKLSEALQQFLIGFVAAGTKALQQIVIYYEITMKISFEFVSSRVLSSIYAFSQLKHRCSCTALFIRPQVALNFNLILS